MGRDAELSWVASHLPALGLGSDNPLDKTCLNRLLDYLDLLAKWNTTYNLTAIKHRDEMLTHHLLDSLSLVPHVTAKRCIDVGTGGGLPGIPLAICLPEQTFYLLDSNSKKTRFLNQVKVQLQLHNVTVIHSRVQDFQPEPRFDCVLSRAYASLSDMINSTRHLLKADGCFLAMKGVRPLDEIQQMPTDVVVDDIIPLLVPELNADRHLVRMHCQA